MGALMNRTLLRACSDILSRSSFFQCQISADDAFEMPVVCAKQQRPILPKRFRAPPNLAIARPDDHFLANGGAMFFPFIRDCRETTGDNTCVIEVQLPENDHCKFGAEHGFSQFDL